MYEKIESYNMSEDDLRKYFIVNAALSYDFLLNTVGATEAHKYKDDSLYYSITNKGREPVQLETLQGTSGDIALEQAYVTSTKRMVALTATGHPYLPGVVNGLPTQANHVSISDRIVPLADLNASDDQSMNVWDGAVFAPYITGKLADASTGDYAVDGMVRKTLGHSVIEHEGIATLNKSATFLITNA